MSKTRTNQEWLLNLRSDGSIQDFAIHDLRELLLRAVLYFFSRNLNDFEGFERREILQRAEDCAQDALIAVLDHLPDFRGDGKFTTWVYKFAINKAMMAARREGWKAVSLDELASSDEGNLFERLMQDLSDDVPPEQYALQSEMQRVIQDVINRDLTQKQRQVLVMIVHEVPLDEVVRHFGTNRNAVYKMLHNARRKLKLGLETQGFDISETLKLFSLSR